MSTTSTFAGATSVWALSSHTYSANFPTEWCIGSVPHGGYVTSVILSVASLHFNTTLSSQNQPHTQTLHLEFLRRTSVGPATITIQDTKLGRRTSNLHFSLSQGSGFDAREEVVGYITNTNFAAENGISLSTNWSLHPARYCANIHKLNNGEDPNYIEKPSAFAQFRKASNKVRFFVPRAGQLLPSLVDEWITFSTGERFTTNSLGLVSDMWPQIVESYRESSSSDLPRHQKQAAFWYPTLVLNLEIKKTLPPEGADWLFVRVRAKTIKNGRMDLEVVILDEEGDIVALSQHVALVLGAERNLAERKGKL